MEKTKRSLRTRSDITWPKGKSVVKFRSDVAKVARTILSGRVLAIDPASGGSSRPGWAWFMNGELVAAGEIPLTKKNPIQDRLTELITIMETGFNHPPPDVLVVEKIRGTRAHHYLHWSVGTIIAGSEAPILLELPIPCWKAIVPDEYVKTDEEDAKYIGTALIMLAKEAENG